MDWDTWNFADSNSTLPAVNVKENNEEFIIDVAAPGLSKKDFKVNYNNGRLLISSEKKNEFKEKEGEKSFQRSFTIPENMVNADKISANYNEGILKISLPKREEIKPKPARDIKIL